MHNSIVEINYAISVFFVCKVITFRLILPSFIICDKSNSEQSVLALNFLKRRVALSVVQIISSIKLFSVSVVTEINYPLHVPSAICDVF